MATYGWGTDRPVKNLLYEAGYRFDFYQAVRLLELLRPDAAPAGEGHEPEKEGVRFKSTVRIDFPANEIHEISPPSEDGGPATMSVNFMGLAGVHGPLPMPYTELILERVWRKDKAFRDFLDIFNHRLISLFYRGRKKHRIGFDLKSPEESHFTNYLFSLFGLGTKGLRGRMKIRDRALLYYTEFLMLQPRSMIGLEYMLSHYLGAAVKGVQLLGQWYSLEEDQITAIGISGQNQILGESALVGARIWDQQSKFEIRVGPLHLDEFLDFLPIGERFTPLCQLTLFYVGNGVFFDAILILNGDEVPESRLGGQHGPRLGWTSWLKTRDYEDEYARVRLTPRLETIETNRVPVQPLRHEGAKKKYDV
ncbi:MAG: type VI secretion system baseplate subunit TssG [Pseudomonadota bacterium]